MTDLDLLIVRGHEQENDECFCSAAHQAFKGGVVALEVRDDHVEKRMIFRGTELHKLDKLMNSNSYKGIYGDMRDDEGLVQINYPHGTEELDVYALTRAKNDQEIEALERLSRGTFELLHGSTQPAEKTFRGAESVKSYHSAFQETTFRGFTQYRGGLQDELGRCSDLTRVEARTPEWESRLQRTYKGLQKVECMLRPGVQVQELQDAFMSEMDEEKDTVYGPPVHHTDFRGYSMKYDMKTLEPFDFVTVGAHVSDGRETAVVNLRGIAIPDYEPDHFRGIEEDILMDPLAKEMEDLYRSAPKESTPMPSSEHVEETEAHHLDYNNMSEEELMRHII